MNRQNTIFLFLFFLISNLISGCGSVKHKPAFVPDKRIDISRIPDAIPRHEPRSRYGNPDSYVVNGRRYYPMRSAEGYVETGIASWYGPNFHGKRTSSREPYNMYAMTAAHKTLPIPSYVEVTNLRNGRRVVVRVNDRGPFHNNRIIDLSYAAAAKLGIIKEGTGLVRVRAIDPFHQQEISQVKRTQKVAVPKVSTPPKAHPPHIKQLYIQLGAFSEIENARKFRNRVQQTLKRPVKIATLRDGGRSLHKVRIGPLLRIEEADTIVRDLNAAGLYEHHVLFQ